VGVNEVFEKVAFEASHFYELTLVFHSASEPECGDLALIYIQYLFIAIRDNEEARIL